MNLLFLPLLASLSLVNSSPSEVTTDPTTYSSTTTEIIPTIDYIVLLGFNLDETKVPEYLVDVIYEEASEKSITTDDIFTLYGLKTVDRITTLNFLEKLNISTEKVFSLDGFDKFLSELRIDFKEFYNKVIIERLNITGVPLRNVLIALNINISNFSTGMAYGDPNPYEEFKKGNYSKESVVSALAKADRTLDDLFLACRDEFLAKALTFPPEKIVESLVKYDFDKNTALQLWYIQEITTESVYKVPGFNQLLNKLYKELNKQPSLGVLTGTSNITINKAVYDTWRDDQNIVEPYAESVTRKFILQIIEKVDTELDNILVLKAAVLQPYKGDINFIDIGRSKSDLRNCQFITLQNETIVTIDVIRAENHVNHIHMPKGNVTDLVLGSPLICDNKLYGLAKEISGDDIVLDSFSAGVNKAFINSCLLSVGIAVFIIIYFL